MSDRCFSRRRFLLTTTSALAFPTIIPSGLIGAIKGIRSPSRPAPSGRINLGIIGYGTMGQRNAGNFLYNDRVQIMAVSDPNRGTPSLYGYNGRESGGMAPCKRRVDRFYAKKTGKAGYTCCKTFPDFRDLIESDVDAVLIATPDHWHAIQAIYAARKGKHVYCQKPMSLTIDQGKAMVKIAKETGITFQVGSQQRSDTGFRRACEFIRNGYLGKLIRIEVGLPSSKKHLGFGKPAKWCGTQAWDNPPEFLGKEGFEMWQGPAKRHAFIPAINAPLGWRYNLAYSGGVITDWGAHHLDSLQWALDRDGDGPVSFENLTSDMDISDPVLNTAANFSFEVVYADGVRAKISNKYKNGITFYGDNGKSIFVTRGRMTTQPAELYRTRLKPGEERLYISGQQERNFIDCIFSGRQTVAPCEVGHRSITIAHIANIGLRLGMKKLEWDPVKELFPKCEAANKLMDTPLYNGWKLDPNA